MLIEIYREVDERDAPTISVARENHLYIMMNT